MPLRPDQIRDALEVALETAQGHLDHNVETFGPDHPYTEASRAICDYIAAAYSDMAAVVDMRAQPIGATA